MAGKIIADTLEHSTAGSVTTDYVVNGSAKAWCNFNGTGTIATRDSLNTSGLVDNGSSDYTVNWSSAFGNADYNFTFGGNVADGVVVAINTGQTAPATSSIRVRSYNASWVGVDGSYINVTVNGDLA